MWVVGFQLTAYAMIAVSTKSDNIVGFYIAIAGAMIMGMASSLGEITIIGKYLLSLEFRQQFCEIGFLKGFDPEVISGWSSGTGFAGVFGAGYNLLLRFLSLSDFIVSYSVLTTIKSPLQKDIHGNAAFQLDLFPFIQMVEEQDGPYRP